MARGPISWLFGVVVGATLGVLFAPRTGKELRARMKTDQKKGNLGIAPLKDDMQKLGQDLAGMAKDIYTSDQVQEIVEKGREKFEELSGDIGEEIGDFRVNKIKQTVRRGKRALKKVKDQIKTRLKKKF